MSENKVNDPIPHHFENREQATEFWDTHSFADYWDESTEVEIEVTAPRRRRVTIHPGLWDKLATLAQAKGVSVETLVNVWLAERVIS